MSQSKLPTQQSNKLSPQERMRRTTTALVALKRDQRQPDDKIRQDLAEAFQKALCERGRFFATNNGAAEKPKTWISPAGVFLLVFTELGIDRHCLRTQESWWAVVQKAMEEALSRGGDQGDTSNLG